MRLIDADAFVRVLERKCGHLPVVVDTLKLLIGMQPTVDPLGDILDYGFDVVDTRTGQYPDWWQIALTEEWAKGLMYCDMDGVAIREDGTLILLDECGNCVSCPKDRFEIRRLPEPPKV